MLEITQNPHERLAETLDKIPHGFPKTKDGITHIKVLKSIYSENEADLASKMKLIGETIEELSIRLNKPIEVLEEQLENMKAKGLIQAINTSTGKRYALMPFIGGVYEEQLSRMDVELAQLMNSYLEQFQKGHIFDTKPAFFRIIPINKVIKPELTIHPFEQARHIVEQSKAWGVRKCICKEQKALLGNPCKYPKTVCLNFSKKKNAFENHPITKSITKDQALNYLQKAEKAGLVHNSLNVQSGHYIICNCCTCCCGILRAVSEWKYPLAYVKSNYQIKVESDNCEGCENCVDRCQFEALKVNNGKCDVDLDRCVGCGVCAISCPKEALSLDKRDNIIHSTPPETLRDWMAQKAISRKVDPSDLL